MEIERIRELRLAHPFKPFNLVLDDGRKLPVDRPWYLGVSPTGGFLIHSSIGGGFERVRPDWVKCIDFDDPEGERSRGARDREGVA